MEIVSKLKMAAVGMISGLLNGLLGSAGGVIAVICLEKIGSNNKSSHAESLAIMLPVSLLSLAFYYLNGEYADTDIVYKILFAGVLGAAVGSICFKKISVKHLKKIFAFLLVCAGVRGLLK